MNWIRTHTWLSVGIAAAITAVIGLTAWMAVIYGSYQSAVVTTATPPPQAAATPTPTPDPLGPYSILLLGHGGPGHDGGSLTDTIILAYIQPRKETIHLISIPRDLWVELPLLPNNQTKGYKVNAAYAVGKDTSQYLDRPEAFAGDGGGGSLAKYAVSQITGIEPTYFMAVNFYAFEEAIDALGGISVRVPQGFDDPDYPIAGEENNTCENDVV
ncbi:MAG: polyisoprenyl-teichoic acid--peptidoglycan teichoic acid transferase [Patescibacteria group bacterium]|nr:polyisoprenyl-teichoic acid--peptidoglycan teichoic acid transferase [Patescibacteria group bacterium]